MSSNKNLDPRHKEFQRYIEQTGVLCMFKHILLNVYADRDTDDAIKYIMSFLGEQSNEVAMKALSVRIAELQSKLDQFENKTPKTQD